MGSKPKKPAKPISARKLAIAEKNAKLSKEKLIGKICQAVKSEAVEAEKTKTPDPTTAEVNEPEAKPEAKPKKRSYPSAAYQPSPKASNKHSKRDVVNCLGCQKPFMSRDKTRNRICPACTHQNDSAREPLEYRVVVERRSPGGMY